MLQIKTNFNYVMIRCLQCIVKDPEEHVDLPLKQSSSYQQSGTRAAVSSNRVSVVLNRSSKFEVLRCHLDTPLESPLQHPGVPTDVRCLKLVFAALQELSTYHGDGFPQSAVYIAGILAHADRVTINRRLYYKETLVREVQRFHQELILPGKAYGELTHPDYYSNSFQSVHPTAVSHQIMAVWWRGNELHGLMRLLDTASGRHAARMLEAGQQLGASSRGWTSLVPDATSGINIVQDDMHLITFDLTPRPASGSFLRTVPDHLLPALHSRSCKQPHGAESGRSPSTRNRRAIFTVNLNH